MSVFILQFTRFCNSPARRPPSPLAHRRSASVGFTQEKVASSTSETSGAWKSAQVQDEKVDSISAAMEASLERLPELYESVRHSIVRIEKHGQ